jgi:predicted dehydrogenase
MGQNLRRCLFEMENKNVKVGLVGYGYWGPNLLRNLHETDGVEVKRCVDLRPERRAAASKRYPTVQVSAGADEILNDSEIDAVVLATPVFTHYDLARRALEANKHVLVEKPMTRTVKEAEELIKLAGAKDLVLMVDHTFVYTGAVRRMKEIIDAGELGELYYFDSVRVNLGLFQHDVDVIWDLAPHDVSILTYLIPEKPKSVSAVGADHTGRELVDVAYLTLHFANNFIAHFHVNWLSPVKVRQNLIGGSRRMVVYDDMEPSEKVRVYDRGIQVRSQEGIYKALVDYRMGDVWSPKLDVREALSVECEHFVNCVRTRKNANSDGESGLRVVKILEAASASIANGGHPVAI